MQNENKRRIALILEYDGTAYSGWQRQEKVPSVQQTVEETLAVLTQSGGRVVIHAASRTDGGVHATGQCVHFETCSRIPAEKLPFALNTMLPSDIRAVRAYDVNDTFHARYSAIGKVYRYSFINRRHAHAILRLTHAHAILPMDANAMHREAQSIIGTHDFSAFAASGSIVKDTVRTMHRAEVRRDGERVYITVWGKGFLYNMVRILAGTLYYVGIGKLPSGTISRALESGSRLDLGITAPACGLCLLRVIYPGEEDLAETEFKIRRGNDV